MNRKRSWLLWSTGLNTLLMIVFAYVFGLYPFCFVLWHLSDPAWSGPGMPAAATSLHERLSPRLEHWARERVASGSAARLDTEDLVETEWPIFGTAFYLWATEALQAAHDADAEKETAPAVRAAGAIDASVALILDPNHGEWVRQHWGDDYLEEENAFYRALLIAGPTSYRNLSGDSHHDDATAKHVAALAEDLSASRHGLLEDYPGECYPGDVLADLWVIQASGHPVPGGLEPFLQQAQRGFDGAALDSLGLPPYLADAKRGIPIGSSRGCSNSYLCYMAPQVWPDKAVDWYARYEQHFWQERFGCVGFREYPLSEPGHEWEIGDMDAGPVIAGYGMAACAFALAAARSNGRYDHAYPLATQMLAASWPLPDGTLLLPRLLSSSTDAPYLGEACILFNLTRQPVDGMPIRQGGFIPPLVYAILATYISASVLVLLAAWQRIRRALRSDAESIRALPVQVTISLALTVAGLGMIIGGSPAFGMMALALAQLLPRVPKPKRQACDTGAMQTSHN
jgi:hypothetical protein